MQLNPYWVTQIIVGVAGGAALFLLLVLAGYTVCSKVWRKWGRWRP